jgi:ribosomal protein S18 acetylase RimI-like enzyme
MDAPEPGHFWKTPFLWEHGCPLPPETSDYSFPPVEQAWLEAALAEVMAHSPDESDTFCVAKYGARKAALDLLALCGPYFERPAGWWQSAVDSSGRQLGFVLPVLFKDPARFKDGRPQGTILHIGVLPPYRGQGVGHALLHQATRTLIAAGCWRIFCDASSRNAPMIGAFRKAGYLERKQWQRPFE